MNVTPSWRGPAPSESFDDGGDALTAADAGGGQAIALAAAAELERERQQQARAGHAERVPERYRAAVDVDTVTIETQFLLDREILPREGLIDLDEIHRLEAQSRPVQRPTRRRGRPMPM